MSPVGLIFLVLIFGLVWLMLIRPQRRRQEQTRTMLGNLRVDDEVVTAGGLIGRIDALDAEHVWLEIAPQLTVKVARPAVAAVVADDSAAVEEEPEPTPTNPG